jgi:hypothetical protein
MTKSNLPRQGDRLELGDPVQPFGESTTEWLFSMAMRSMHSVNDQGRDTYLRCIAALRERSEELLATLNQIEDRIPVGSHEFEWGLHYILAELENPILMPKLIATAVRKVAERNQDMQGCERPEDMQVLVQIMAVEAIDRLIKHDRQQAIQALLEVVKAQPHFAIRRPGVQAIIEADPSQIEVLQELLPENQRFMLDLKRVPVEYLNASIHPAEVRPRPNRPGAAPRLDEHRTSPNICTCHGKEF